MIEIKSPNEYVVPNEYTWSENVFLAGSIEMGTAKEWQSEIVEKFKNENVVFLNPRRDDWDSAWAQSIENEQFREQVEWELKAIHRADVVIFVFDGDTKSPITLLELGNILGRSEFIDQTIYVYCPNNFWRKGNVDVTCAYYGVIVYDDWDSFMMRLWKDLSTN